MIISERPNYAGEYYDFDGTEARIAIINCALLDSRVNQPRANYARVGEYIDAYLTMWERIKESASG